MSFLRVGILRGGRESHYEESIKKAGLVFSHLFENLSHKYKPVDIFIDQQGVWHLQGLPISPAELSNKIDVAWNFSHPELNSTLSNLSIPTIGAGHFSLLLRNPLHLKEHMQAKEIKTLRSILLPAYQSDFDGAREEYVLKKAREIWQKFSPPWLVRAFSPTSNKAQKVVKTFPDLVDVLNELSYQNTSVLVEEILFGKEAKTHSIPLFRGEKNYFLSPVAVLGDQLSPVGFSKEEKAKILSFCEKVNEHISPDHYLCTSVILTPKGQCYLKSLDFDLDLNSEHFLDALSGMGLKEGDIVEHLLDRAIV